MVLTCIAMEKLKTWLASERGRVTKLAAACSITHSAVLQWNQIPADKVLEVERVTGISRHDLRPDVFGKRTPTPSDRSAA